MRMMRPAHPGRFIKMEIIDPLEANSDDPIREITQRYTAALERLVRRSPEQYFWVHRRWKSVPRQRRRRQKAAA